MSKKGSDGEGEPIGRKSNLSSKGRVSKKKKQEENKHEDIDEHK